MSNFIQNILESSFSTSHNDNELMHLMLLLLLSFISKTYWQSSRISLQAMKEENELVYGSFEDDGQSASNPENLDAILQRLRTLKIDSAVSNDFKIDKEANASSFKQRLELS